MITGMHRHEILYIESTLGMSRKELAEIVGCSASSLYRASLGSRTERVMGKETELLQLVLRMTRALAHLYGKNIKMARMWLRISQPGTPPLVMQLTSVEKLVSITVELEQQMAAGKLLASPTAVPLAAPTTPATPVAPANLVSTSAPATSAAPVSPVSATRVVSHTNPSSPTPLDTTTQDVPAPPNVPAPIRWPVAFIVSAPPMPAALDSAASSTE